jgi:hypothetical protein
MDEAEPAATACDVPFWPMLKKPHASRPAANNRKITVTA